MHIEGMMTEIDLKEGILPLKPPSHALEASQSNQYSPEIARRELSSLEVWPFSFQVPLFAESGHSC
jgi:hypothetical protein